MASLAIKIDRTRVERLLHGGVSVVQPAGTFKVEGPGALDCLQGLLTSDLIAPGPNHLMYGAILTPKGMIVVDLLVARRAADFIITTPWEGRPQLADLLRRSIPPRLATVEDLSDSWSTMWLYGDHAEAALAESRLIHAPVEPGTVTDATLLGFPVVIAVGSVAAPFKFLLTGPQEAIDQVGIVLADHGISSGDADDYHTARILAGWPELGLEIGTKTLPQEVRFEALEGVSFTKGCFVGQETVSRVHFRGRTQREVRGLDWLDLQPLEGNEIHGADRLLGEVHSVLILPDRRIGLGTVRREANIGDSVLAGGREAKVTALPFDPPVQAA
jgi:folate-binding protein YgfZ